MTTEPAPHLTLWDLGPQQPHVTFDGGRLVTDAGLLAVRALEKPLRVIAGLAERLPDPRAAQCRRIKVLNEYLVELFLRTRPAAPAEVVLDVDASDDPVHGGQALSGYHGYFRQHQYFPLLVYDGGSGFPLAAWLRPGTVHASCGAVEVLRPIVRALRAAWPGLRIVVRADNGLAVPAVYAFCEAEG